METHNISLTLPSPPEGKTGWPWQADTYPDTAVYDAGYPKISIVTPSYNQGAFIEETIRSVLLQGYPNFEYIVIDGRSSDNTLDILQRYQKHIAYWVSEADDGPADAIRKGWERATGDIVAYLNSDDAYLPGTLFTVARAFQQFPETAMLCGNELWVNEAGDVLKQSDITEVTYTSLLQLQFIPQPSVFIRRKALTQAGGIDPTIRYTFDYELWLRITRTFPVQCVSNVLAVTRWHEQTITLKQRPNVGEQLLEVVTREIRLNPCRFPRNERGRIVCRAHRFAMILHLEQSHTFRAALHALRAIVLCPDYQSVKTIIRKYFKRFCRPAKNVVQIPEKSVHWSDFRNNAL